MPSQDTWSSVSGSTTSSNTGRVRNWVRTPNFGSIPKDSLPVNSYTDWVIRTLYEPRYYSYVYNPTGVRTWEINGACGTAVSVLNAASPLITEVHANGLSADVSNAAKIKCLNKVSDAKTNLAVALAEASKTSDLILDTARRIDRAYRAFRRGNFGEVAKQLNITPGRVHKNWLEYKYGWMPLLMDVKNSAEFLAQESIGRALRFSCKASEQRTGTLVKLSTTGKYGATPTIPLPVTQSLTWSVKHTAKLWCELQNPHLSAAQQLGITNPALVVWELVPFSFVFDWFIQVGNYLQAVTALDGVTVRRGMQSSVDTYAYYCTFPSSVHTQGNYTYSGSGLNMSLTLRQYSRYAWSPDPSELYPPSAKGIQNLDRLITSLALIKGSYRGSGSSRI